MKTRSTIVSLVALVLITCATFAYATNVRGKVSGKNRYSTTPYPLAKASVVLYNKDSQGKWRLVSRYITGSNGIYYFRNVDPGNYVVQVNRRWKYRVSVRNQANQDLPPIVINF